MSDTYAWWTAYSNGADGTGLELAISQGDHIVLNNATWATSVPRIDEEMDFTVYRLSPS